MSRELAVHRICRVLLDACPTQQVWSAGVTETVPILSRQDAYRMAMAVVEDLFGPEGHGHPK